MGLLREFEDGDEDSIHQLSSDEDSGVFEDNGDNMPALLLQEKVDVQEKDDLMVTADSAETKQPSTVTEEIQAAAVGAKRKVGGKNGVALAAACLVAAAAVLVVWR